MTDARSCPRCGAELPPDESDCPACLMELAVAETGHGSGGPPADVDFSIEELADRFPQLEIIELLGRGGMGAVYKARQPKLNRFVALKILPPRLGREVSFADRFEREAQVLAQLNHPNIVTVYDFGEAEGLYYLLMEYVDGVNLRQSMQSGHLAADQALTIVPQICDALQFAHDEGVVHRDIKPENILLDTRGRVKIADFGLAKLYGDAATDQKQLTVSHQVMGTLHYMAPEQMQNPLDVDHRADIYSLGVVFYELLTGQLPLGRFDPPSERSGVSSGLDEVVLRTLEQQPDKRYQQASDVKTGIESAARHQDASAAVGSGELSAEPAAGAIVGVPQQHNAPNKPPIVRKPPAVGEPQLGLAAPPSSGKPKTPARQPEVTVVTVLLWLTFLAASVGLNWFGRGFYSPIFPFSTIIWFAWSLVDATALTGVVVWIQQRNRGLKYPAFGGEHVWRLAGWTVLVWMVLRVPLMIVRIVESQGAIEDPRISATVALAILIAVTIFHGLGTLIVTFMIREPQWKTFTFVMGLANLIRIAVFILTIVGMWAGFESFGGIGVVSGLRFFSCFPVVLLLVAMASDAFADEGQSWTHWTGGGLELVKFVLFMLPAIVEFFRRVI